MNTNPSARPARSHPARRGLRTAAAVVAVAPFLALAACSGEAPITSATATTAPETGATAAPTGGETATGAPTTATTPGPSPTTLTTKGSIKDDVLGHVITPAKVVVNLPWPDNHPIAAEHFELVGVEVKVQAGSRYSANVTPDMFALKTSSPDPVPATNEFKGALGKELATVNRGKTGSGWLIFKVEKGSTTALELRFNRPAYDVKTTDKTIPAKSFSLKLTP
ncbi:MAG: hypothetical protein ACTHJJ_03165 [Intrasporangium sp.]|uniref:hypothetical protein n=1 Tax=Intrasporangium sp. TaxID=1925024 RepID=UPI003F7D134A